MHQGRNLFWVNHTVAQSNRFQYSDAMVSIKYHGQQAFEVLFQTRGGRTMVA